MAYVREVSQSRPHTHTHTRGTLPAMLWCRRALNQLADRQRLSETALLRRAAQLLVYQWTKAAEKTGWIGRLGIQDLEVRGHGRLARLVRNFVNNLREEVKRVGGGRG